MSDPKSLRGALTAALAVVLCHALATVEIAASDLPSPLAGEGLGRRGRGEVSAAPVGAGRCSAVACHGSPGPVFGSRVLRNEHGTWATSDPHANAYATLGSERSWQIARNLARGGAAPVPPARDGRCLACHATPGADPAQPAILADGVGCEACHGPAASWLGPHTTYGWDGLSPREKQERFGLRDLAGVVGRAETCCGCHVGEPARDGRPSREVNHDLIAAGHPRLEFELSAHLALLPAHWIETGRNAGSDFPARAWAVGRVVAARSSVALLEGRAEAAAARRGPWPEFAEYECASCHHSLRPNPRATAGKAGRLPWGTWYYALIPELAGHAASSPEVVARCRALGEQMERPYPELEAVASEAARTRAALTRWLAALEAGDFDAGRARGVIDAVRSAPAAGGRGGDLGRDLAANRYLALIPLRQVLPDADPLRPPLLREILALRGWLMVPAAEIRVGGPSPGSPAPTP